MKGFPRYIMHSVFCLVMISALTASTCLTQSQLDKAANASKTIATYTGDVITTVDTLWKTGVIKSIAVKDQIAQKLKDFSISGRDFNNLIISYSKQYSAGAVPTNVWQDIVAHFDQLTKIFVDVLTIIPQLAGLTDSKAFKLITAAVLTLAQLFINVGGINLPQFQRIKQLVPGWQNMVRDYDQAIAA